MRLKRLVDAVQIGLAMLDPMRVAPPAVVATDDDSVTNRVEPSVGEDLAGLRVDAETVVARRAVGIDGAEAEHVGVGQEHPGRKALRHRIAADRWICRATWPDREDAAVVAQDPVARREIAGRGQLLDLRLAGRADDLEWSFERSPGIGIAVDLEICASIATALSHVVAGRDGPARDTRLHAEERIRHADEEIGTRRQIAGVVDDAQACL